jgi:hypothetical protein
MRAPIGPPSADMPPYLSLCTSARAPSSNTNGARADLKAISGSFAQKTQSARCGDGVQHRWQRLPSVGGSEAAQPSQSSEPDAEQSAQRAGKSNPMARREVRSRRCGIARRVYAQAAATRTELCKAAGYNNRMSREHR